MAITRCIRISIHAPQWGATGPLHSRRSTRNDFNPRTPVGCDYFNERYRTLDMISIHAPQWGATLKPRLTPRPPSYFNPRTPVGCDRAVASALSRLNLFQSTHPSGVRRVTSDAATVLNLISIHAPQWGATPTVRHNAENRGYFNPRTPVGCDNKPRHSTTRDNRFQSTHPSGVRPAAWGTKPIIYTFQSTHPSGVRRQYVSMFWSDW